MRMMNRVLLTAAVLLLGVRLGRAADPVLQPNDHVVVCGDSITEQKIYSVFIEDYLLMCQPAAGLRAAQTGWSGEAAPAFARRIPADIMPLRPTVVTTCYGMNDGAYRPFDQTLANTYRTNQLASIKAFKAAGVRVIVLGSAGAVDSTAFRRGPATAAQYNDTLAKYADIDKQLAADEGILFADVHSPMMDIMAKAKEKYGTAYALAGTADGIHPQANGHLVMAYAYLKALGCDGNIATITFNMTTGKADATPGQKILASTPTSIDLESTKYPFCFFGDPKSPDATTGILEFLPFNQDLNRYTLVVKGATGKIKVTWGTASKEFDAADLARGVNLAAEFLDNPFCEPFKAVEAKIKAQQAFETPLNKQLLHNLPPYEAYPETKDATAGMRTALVAHDKQLQADVAAALTPVKHTLKIEPVK